MASLTLKGVTKRFEKITVLSRVDLHVEDGEFCVLLGPSGCGKSTLLNIVAGLVPQDEGTVMLNGKSIDRSAPRDRDMAMVFQNYALYPHMTVAQNLGFGLRMRGTAGEEIQSRVLEAVRLLGIGDLLERKPRELSGGQRQRVAMGRALVRRPTLFLLDEPLSNLDARLRSSVRLELKRLHGELKGTFLYVTHDQVEAMTLGDRVAVMGEGRIHQFGRPENIYARPADTFVATFIGSPEMNLYEGLLFHEGGQAFFEGPGFRLGLGASEGQFKEGEVELGVRPEDIRVGKNESLKAVVEMMSDAGSEKYVHARLGRAKVTVRVEKDASCREGEVLGLGIEPRRTHIFRDGRRIRTGD